MELNVRCRIRQQFLFSQNRKKTVWAKCAIPFCYSRWCLYADYV